MTQEGLSGGSSLFLGRPFQELCNCLKLSPSAPFSSLGEKRMGGDPPFGKEEEEKSGVHRPIFHTEQALNCHPFLFLSTEKMFDEEEEEGKEDRMKREPTKISPGFPPPFLFFLLLPILPSRRFFYPPKTFGGLVMSLRPCRRRSRLGRRIFFAKYDFFCKNGSSHSITEQIATC